MEDYYDPKVAVAFIRRMTDKQLLERIYQAPHTMHMRLEIEIQELAAFCYGVMPERMVEHCEVEVIKPEVIKIEGS